MADNDINKMVVVERGLISEKATQKLQQEQDDWYTKFHMAYTGCPKCGSTNIKGLWSNRRGSIARFFEKYIRQRPKGLECKDCKFRIMGHIPMLSDYC